jgi:acyl-coenzyme A thioesterase PaaI-like protein
MTLVNGEDEARTRAAAALRRLGHAIVAHDVETELLERIVELTDRTTATVEAGAERKRQVDELKRRQWRTPPEDGEQMSHFRECIVSGDMNPMGIGIKVWRDGDEAAASFRLGPAFEGAPERAHGGITAAVFDDVMGYALLLNRTPAFTGRLTINYLAPVPIGPELTVRSRLRSRNGRKLWIDAEMHLGEHLVAEAEGLFIAVPPERLGLPSDGTSEVSTAGAPTG